MSVVAVIIVIRVVLWLLNNYQPAGGQPKGLPFKIPWLRVLAFCVALAVLRSGQPLVAALLFLAGVVPGRLAQHVLVPLGIPHLTDAVFRSVHLGFGNTNALFHELCARLRFGWALSPKALTRLERRLRHVMGTRYEEDTEIQGAAIAARAILDAARGQRETARELFLVAQSLPGRLSSPGSQSLSQGWLLADATARRDFAEVLRLCGEGPATLQRAYFRSLARRQLGLPPLGWRDRLAGRCAPIACPGPLAALRLAQLVGRVQPAGPLPLPAPDRAIDFAAAKRALIGAASRPLGSVSRAELRSVGKLWQELDESNALTDGVAKFAAHAGQTQSAFFDLRSASRELLDEVVDVFEQLWRHTLPEKEPADESCPLILEVQDRIEQQATSELDRLIARLPSDKDRDLSVEDCWRAWARLQALARDAMQLLPGRTESILGPLRNPMINWGAWLFNDNSCKVLGFAVFHWWLEHTPKSDENYELLENNTRLARGAV